MAFCSANFEMFCRRPLAILQVLTKAGLPKPKPNKALLIQNKSASTNLIGTVRIRFLDMNQNAWLRRAIKIKNVAGGKELRSGE